MVAPVASTSTKTIDKARMQAQVGQVDRFKTKLENPQYQRQKIRELSEEFESIFLDIVLQSMRKTVPKSEFIEASQGEEVFRSMLDSEYAKVIAKQHQTGLADTIAKELEKAAQLEIKTIEQQQGRKIYQAQGLNFEANRGKIRQGKDFPSQ